MSPERWQQVKKIMEEALELPNQEQITFLEQVCNADTELKEEVLSLLTIHRKAEDFLESPALANSNNLIGLDQNTENITLAMSSHPVENTKHQNLIGTILDGLYLIETLIGQGGMGDVYRAKHTLLNRLVAIKLISKELSQDPTYKKLFLREGKAASLIEHPNAVALYDLRESEDKMMYLVMEYIEGQTLKDELIKKEKISVLETCKLLTPIISALAEAHKKGVIHRDIKPGNIMISKTADKTVVKLLDLGIAKISQKSSNEELSTFTNNQVLGTPYYMSPEQWKSPSNIDARADIYSLGVIFYELVAGQKPFTGPSLETLAYQHAVETPKFLHEFLPTVPIEFSQLVAKMMAKERSDRPASCEELNNLLERVIKNCNLLNLPTNKQELVLTANPSADNPVTLKESIGKARKPKLILISSTIIAILFGSLFIKFWSVSNKSILQTPELTPILLTSNKVSYNLELQEFREGKHQKPTLVVGEKVILHDKDQVRFNIEVEQAGYIYLLNESPKLLAEKLPRYTILFPILKENNYLEIKQVAKFPKESEPSIEIGGSKGIEKFWLIYSKQQLSEFESLRLLPSEKNLGVIEDHNQAKFIERILAKYLVTKIEENKLTKQMQALSSEKIIILVIELEYR